MRFILVSVFKMETKMGTYTTNYNLFLPTIGEQGWGELVNGNFTTIDTAMKGLNTRIATLETETDAIEERVTTLEAGNFESANIGSLIVGDGVFNDSVSTNLIKMPVSNSNYLIAITKQTSNTKTSTTTNWGNANITQTCTVSELFTYITNRFRPLGNLLLSVTISISPNNADHSATIKVNGTTVKTFNVNNGTGSTYTANSLELTDTITVDTNHRSRTAGTSSLTVTISTPVFGI